MHGSEPWCAAQAPLADYRGETRLLRSLLLGAIEDLLVGNSSTGDSVANRGSYIRARTAQLWMSGDPGAAFSFDDCCLLGFGVAPSRMRAKIAKLAESYHHSRGRRWLALQNARPG